MDTTRCSRDPGSNAAFLEALVVFESSEIAVEIFGEAVHHHLLNSARQEWLAANRSATDWERRRYFALF